MTSPFHHEARASLTQQQFAQVWVRQDGRCAGPCHRKLRVGDKYDADHVIALENGGTNDIDNFQILCDGCHTMKTKQDHAKAGHSRRTFSRHVAPKRYGVSKSWGRR